MTGLLIDHGADVQRLRELARNLARASDDARSASDSCVARLRKLDWRGTDAKRFLDQHLRRIGDEGQALARALTRCSNELEKHAAEQDRVQRGEGGEGCTDGGPSGKRTKSGTAWPTKTETYVLESGVGIGKWGHIDGEVEVTKVVNADGTVTITVRAKGGGGLGAGGYGGITVNDLIGRDGASAGVTSSLVAGMVFTVKDEKEADLMLRKMAIDAGRAATLAGGPTGGLAAFPSISSEIKSRTGKDLPGMDYNNKAMDYDYPGPTHLLLGVEDEVELGGAMSGALKGALGIEGEFRREVRVDLESKKLTAVITATGETLAEAHIVGAGEGTDGGNRATGIFEYPIDDPSDLLAPYVEPDTWTKHIITSGDGWETDRYSDSQGATSTRDYTVEDSELGLDAFVASDSIEYRRTQIKGK